MRWVVDPLDGTTNFVYGYPAYAASIAAEVGGVARVGVVYDSVTGMSYEAIAGHGAWCGERRLSVRKQNDLSRALVATGFSYDAAERQEAGLAPWDHAAGALIAREAGADVRHLLSASGHTPVIVAAHPILMPALLALLVEAKVISES